MISTARQAIIMYGALHYLKTLVPKHTGNMRYNATKIENLGGGKWRLYVDENIAPYVPYTNEPWISPKWNGKQNPNEGWFERATHLVANYISSALQGSLKKAAKDAVFGTIKDFFKRSSL